MCVCGCSVETATRGAELSALGGKQVIRANVVLYNEMLQVMKLCLLGCREGGREGIVCSYSSVEL
jgi:hypothetical protein